jgi:hypothetical protein
MGGETPDCLWRPRRNWEAKIHIVELKVESFKKLRVVAVRPGSPLVVISGKNSAGKSSVLNAIVTALEGITVAGPTPIREGEERSTIRLDLGEYIVTRTFTRGKDGEISHKLVLTNADGTKPAGTPQAILNSLLGGLTFDPLAFGRWKPKDQFDAVRALVPGFDFTEYDAAQKRDYDARTNINRIAEEHAAAANKVVIPPGPKPAPVVVTEVMAELETARKHNAEIVTRRQRRVDAEAEIEKWRDEAETLRAQASALEKRADETEVKLSAAAKLPEPKDESALVQLISAAEGINAVIRAHDDRDAHERHAAEAKKKSAELTAARKAREDAKTAAIAAAKMPIAGLDLSDGEVKFNGLPLASAGTSERIRVGMAIAAALNPKLKVVLIDELSEIDPETMKEVAAFAGEHDLQVWGCTCHSDSGQPEVVIENGEIAKETKA